jgi:dipeptidyl aminopeptidase/acylaminoacyl peptidase
LTLVYGGPNSQLVKMKLSMDEADKMASNQFIHVTVDSRGTGFKGRKFKTTINKHLGKYEVQDQITAAK